MGLLSLPVVGKAIDKVLDIVDKFVPDKELARKLKQEVLIAEYDAAEKEMKENILSCILEITQSPDGAFGVVDERGDYISLSLTSMWSKCELPDEQKTFKFPREIMIKAPTWVHMYRTRQPIIVNDEVLVPEGHIKVNRVMGVPIIYENRLVGLIAVANKSTDYTEEDKCNIEKLANEVAPHFDEKLIVLQGLLHIKQKVEQEVEQKVLNL